jgi:hypothetical protein
VKVGNIFLGKQQSPINLERFPFFRSGQISRNDRQFLVDAGIEIALQHQLAGKGFPRCQPNKRCQKRAEFDSAQQFGWRLTSKEVLYACTTSTTSASG